MSAFAEAFTARLKVVFAGGLKRAPDFSPEFRLTSRATALKIDTGESVMGRCLVLYNELKGR